MSNEKISVTGVFCAFVRGWHSDRESPKVFDDAFASRLIPPDRMQSILQAFGNPERISGALRSMPTTAQVLSRSSWAERELAAARARGCQQYVILGAGLDSFSLRNGGENPLAVFEVDAPATQEFKKAQLVRVNGRLPERTFFVSADLSSDCLRDALTEKGFKVTAKCFVSMLGLLMYLDPAGIDVLFGSLGQMASAGSELVFDWFDDTAFDETKSSEAFTRQLAQSRMTGETYRATFTEDAVRALAERHGFTVAESLDPAGIERAFFSGRSDGYHACEHAHFSRLTKK